MPLNGASLLLLDTFSGQVIALALLLVLTVNLTLMWHHRGMNKDMSLVHLLAWIPLEIALLGQLATLGRRSPDTGTVGFHPCGIHGQRHQPVLRCGRCLVLGPGRSPDPPPGKCS